MNTSRNISSYQLFTLITSFMIGSTIIILPVAQAKQDAWIAFLIGLSGGFVLMITYNYIFKLNAYENLIVILKRCFGKYLGSLLSIFYIWYFIHLAALVLRNYGEYSLIISYQHTPIFFIIATYASVIAYAVYKGIEVVGRISELFLLTLILVVVMVFFLTMGLFKLDNLKPILSNGWAPILKSAFSVLTFPLGETVAFLMVFPHINNKKSTFKTSIIAIVVFGIVLLNAIFRNIMVLGTNMILRDMFPSHIVFRLTPGVDIDPLLDLILLFAGIVKSGVCIYAASAGISELFGLKDYTPFVLSITALSVTISIWLYKNVLEMVSWAANVWPFYSIPFQIVIPFIVLIISLFKYKHTIK